MISRWFGAEFERLIHVLQALHLRGGDSAGAASRANSGFRCKPDPHTLRVEIGRQPDCLLWNRRFGARQRMDSTFRPVGAWPDGLWLEQTGPVRLGLAVEVIGGAWYWRCRKA